MPDKNISIGESFKFSWGSFKNNIGYFVQIFVVILAIYIGLLVTSFFTSLDSNPAPNAIIALINSIFEIVISIGLIKIAITFTRGDKPLVSDVFSSYQIFFKFLFSTILNSLIVFVGFLLFIIPGVIWSLKFSQYRYLVVDKKMGPIEALKESSKLTQGAKWELLGFIIVSSLVNLLGFAFFFVGLLVTAPVTMLAAAHIYQQLLDQEKSEVNETSTPTPISPSTQTPSPPSTPTPPSKPESETKPKPTSESEEPETKPIS